MDQDTANTYTGLFRQAQKWITDNPRKQMDRVAWWGALSNANTAMKEKVVYAGGYKVTNATGAVIPVLAAVSLGMPSEELAQVIKHHGLTFQQISDCIFTCSDSPFQTDADEAKYLSIDTWRVTSEVVKAMSEAPSLSEGLAEEAKEYEDYSDLDIARLLSSNEDFWPVTAVREILAEKSAESSKIRSIQPVFTDIHSFSYTHADFDDFTDEQVFTLLERTGHLCPGTNRENGFSCSLSNAFFNNLFLLADADGHKNFQRMIHSMNAVKDPKKIDLITARLMESLTDYPFERDEYGIETLGLMEQYLDQRKYSAVINSMTIKLNLMPYDLSTGTFARLDSETWPPCFEDFIHSDSTIFKRLHDELIGLDPSTFRHSHFGAIRKAIQAVNSPQDITGIDMPQLLKTVLLALDAYGSKTHYTVVGSTTRKHVEQAAQDVCTLIRFASKQKDLDYSRFQDFPSAAKAHLASNGFDIRKLPGMSRRDKGQVLSDGLGL
jgi:hypothetical protein